jgi:hypothetical protein
MGRLLTGFIATLVTEKNLVAEMKEEKRSSESVPSVIRRTRAKCSLAKNTAN